MTEPATPSPSPPAAPDLGVDLVRRRLLSQGGRYAVPAVLATLLLQDTVFAQTSCNPNLCEPANPKCGPTTNCTPYQTCGPGAPPPPPPPPP